MGLGNEYRNRVEETVKNLFKAMTAVFLTIGVFGVFGVPFVRIIHKYVFRSITFDPDEFIVVIFGLLVCVVLFIFIVVVLNEVWRKYNEKKRTY